MDYTRPPNLLKIIRLLLCFHLWLFGLTSGALFRVDSLMTNHIMPAQQFLFDNIGILGHSIPSSLIYFDLVLYVNRTSISHTISINDKGTLPADKNTTEYKNLRLFLDCIDEKQHTYFVTHGFQSSTRSAALSQILNRVAKYGLGNAIGVNWSKMARGPYYQTASIKTKEVAEHVATFIELLVREKQIKPANITLIGHSLGAHISGFAARKVKSGKIGRIDGLDPAGPYFKHLPPKSRLNSDDADFVNIIHVDTRYFGIEAAIGHVDFYVNGGKDQPLCTSTLNAAGCSHLYANVYFFRSIMEKYLGAKCPNYDDFQNDKCPVDPKVRMGFHTPICTRGIYYVGIDV